MNTKINVKISKQIGLFTAICMLISSVIGAGIFLKNQSVFANNGNNAIGISISWILGALISLCCAYSFAEIGTCTKSHAGFAGWCEKLINYKFGYFVRLMQPIFYFGIMVIVMGTFAAESIFYIFPKRMVDQIHFGYILLIGFVFSLLFITIGYISVRTSGIISNIVTIMKFFPLVSILFIGISFSVIYNSAGLFDPKNDITRSLTTNLSFQGIISSLPSILFAFDSFTNVGSLATEMKKPEKNVPLTIVIGMIVCAVMYLLVTIGLILTGEGNALNIFNNFNLSSDVKFTLATILKIFVVISIVGSLNSFSMISLRSFNSLFENERFFAHQEEIKKIIDICTFQSNNPLRYGFFSTIFVTFFWFLIVLFPSIFTSSSLGSDVFIDGLSNFPVLFFFLIYAILIIAGIYNRYSKKHDVIKQKGFICFAIIGSLGSLLIFCYTLFYNFLYQPINDLATNNFTTVNWGLFWSNGVNVYTWEAMILFFTCLAFLITFPVGNYIVLNNKLKKEEKNKQIFMKK